MNLTIRTKVLALAGIMTILPVTVMVGLTAYKKSTVGKVVLKEVDQLARENTAAIATDMYHLCEAAHELVQQQIASALNVAEDIVDRSGALRFGSETVAWTAVNQYTKQGRSIELPRMYFGDTWLGQNTRTGVETPLVDAVDRMVPSTCTIFQRMNDAGDMLRVATNVMKTDGNRAIGTYIPAVNPDGTPNPVIREVMKGNTFYGRAYVVNAWYQTAYRPLRDGDGRIVGILYVGIKQEAVESLRHAIMDTKVGKTGYVYVLGGSGDQKGQYIISKDGARDGEDIWGAKDADGRLFIQSIVEKAVGLSGQKVAFERYPWKNAGESTSRMKLAAITYFEPWDWVIGAGTYEDDYHAAKTNIDDSLSSIISGVIMVSLVILIVGFVIVRILAGRIAKPVEWMADAAIRISEGDLDVHIDHDSGDETGTLARAFREMTDSLRAKKDAAEAIAAGDLSADVTIVSERDELGRAMDTMKERLNALKRELDGLIDRQQRGEINYRCNPRGFNGSYGEILTGINTALDAVVNPVVDGITLMNRYAEGDLSDAMRDLPGEQQMLTDGLNKIRANVHALVAEGRRLTDAAINGQLSVRGESAQFSGDYRDVIDGMNATLDNLLAPIGEAVACLQRMADGDLSVRMSGDFKGDHSRIKDALNTTLSALNDTFGKMTVAAEEVARGAEQVADASASVSQGATEQASSVEETSATLVEIKTQARHNAENSAQANVLAREAGEQANAGNGDMQSMLTAMDEINESSEQVSRIIKVIDEIAFQTNLLALNAAVEAARAGVHGKGFAVVAEEVRSLAQRCAKAAGETTELIETTVGRVSNGTEIAHKTAKGLGDIIGSVDKVRDLIGDISAASTEQAEAIEQLNTALEQIDRVTQSNTASAEESASASEELAGQAEELRRLATRFTLAERPRRSAAAAPVAAKRTAAPPRPTVVADAEPELEAFDEIVLD